MQYNNDELEEKTINEEVQQQDAAPVTTTTKRERKPAAAKEEETSSKEIVDVYQHGFKIPLQLHSQHARADAISFRKGNVQYRLKPADILNLANSGNIVPGVSVGKLPWSAAIGLFINNLDGGRNKTFSNIIENSKQNIINNNLQ